ncbi:MAG: DUF3568 family protein [Gemmatimonadaceae bacterium]|nr:DUF3568 family protein [Gemmatimonadaceae bacterium]
MRPRLIALRLVLASTPIALSGCFLAAAGAGAAGAIAYTNRGASSEVGGTVDQVFDRAVTSFGQNGVAETGRSIEDNGRKRRLLGKKGEQDVTVELERDTEATTKVEVIARKNAVDYDKELAKTILNGMLAR